MFSWGQRAIGFAALIENQMIQLKKGEFPTGASFESRRLAIMRTSFTSIGFKPVLLTEKIRMIIWWTKAS
jgi:hypothetical protein